MENKSNFRVINFNSQFTIPQYIELPVKGSWVRYGENNLYGDYLLSLMNKSSKHNAIIKSKAAMVAGNGWNKDSLTPEQSMFIFNQYSKDNLNEVISKAAYDLELFGAYALEVIWSNDRSKISCINHIDVSKVRIATPENGIVQADSYYVSDDWSRLRSNQPILYPGFSQVNRSKGSQILYVKDFRPGCEFYGIPEYISATNWIELEYEISQFHLTSIQGGFTPDLIINFSQGIPGSEEMDDVIRRLEKQYAGTKGKKVIFTFSDGPSNAPTITPVQLNDSDQRFIELNKNVTEGIMVGHRVVNPSLFGIKTEGELGGKNNILESMAVFKAQYIDAKVQLLENVFNKFTAINGIGKIYIDPFKIKLDIQPNVSDLLNVLAAQISDEQKVNILLSIGYERPVAESIVKNNTI